MSEGIAKVDTMMCYQCEVEEIDYDPVDIVHPLCEYCQSNFDDWLQDEITKLG